MIELIYRGMSLKIDGDFRITQVPLWKETEDGKDKIYLGTQTTITVVERNTQP